MPSFLNLQAGLRLAIWKREDIVYEAKDTQSPASPTEFKIGHYVSSKEEK